MLSLGVLDPLTRGAVSLPALLPPFGASTVIVFYAPETAASRAWNVLVGHFGSALVALLVISLLPEAALPTRAAFAVSGAAIWMVATRSVHPPGGATALLGVISQSEPGNPAYLLPVMVGSCTLVAIRALHDLALYFVAEFSADQGDSLAAPLSERPDVRRR